MKDLMNYLRKLPKRIRDFLRGKQSKSLRGDGGTVDLKWFNIYTVNSIILLLVAVFNLFKGILHSENLLYYALYVVLFILMILLNEILKRKNVYKWNAFLYATLGIGTMFNGEPGNYAGAVFIIFSIFIFNTHKTNIILMMLTFIGIVGKNILYGFEITNTVNLMVAYIYIFLIYYILIHPKPEKSRLIFCPELDYETIQIIQYLADGLIYKEIAPFIEMTETSIRKRITRAREVMQVKSTPELVIKCHKLDYIRYKLDKTSL